MTINDVIYGELEYDYGWSRVISIDYISELHLLVPGIQKMDWDFVY